MSHFFVTYVGILKIDAGFVGGRDDVGGEEERRGGDECGGEEVGYDKPSEAYSGGE